MAQPPYGAPGPYPQQPYPQQPYPQQPYPQQQQGPPPKKGGSGCKTCLMIGGCLTVLGLIGVGGAAYWVWQQPEVQKIAKVVGKGAEIIREATNAKGTEEVRDAGCDQAFALDIEKFAELGDLLDAGAPEMPEDAPKRIVVCQVSEASSAPDCDDIAKAYQKGASPDGKFALMVQASGRDKPECSKLYDKSGKSISDYAGSAPPIPLE
jgi:hypothetical protein